MSGSFCILFILLPFFFGRLSCANQPDVAAPFRVNNYQKTVFVRDSDQDEPVFFLGMQGIINGQGQGVSKGRACFVKRNAMDFEVFFRLVRVPFKQKHSSSLRASLYPCYQRLTIRADSRHANAELSGMAGAEDREVWERKPFPLERLVYARHGREFMG
jgi:hypothetical protein